MIPRISIGCTVLIAISVARLHAAPIDNDVPSERPNTTTVPVPSESVRSAEDIVRDTIGPGSDEANPERQADPASQASLLALQAFQSGDISECLSQLKTAVAKRPTLPSPNVILAGFHLRAGQGREARRLLEQEARKSTRHPQLYLSLAKLALAENRLTDAEVHYDKLDSLDVPASWTDAENTWLRTSVLEGRANLAEQREHWDAAAALFSQLHQLQPQNVNWQLRTARALFQAEEFDQAYEQLDIASRRDPKIGPPDLAMAVLYTRAKKYKEADRWYQKVLARMPDDARARSSYVMSLLYQNRGQEAKDHALKIVDQHGSSTMLELQLGIAARQLGQLDDAREHLLKALELSPNSDEAQYHLILTMAAMDDPDARQQALERGKEFVKAQPDSALALSAMGAAYHAEKQFTQAEEVLQRAVTSPLMRPEGLFILGKVYQAQNRQEKAAKVAEILAPRLDEAQVFVLRKSARDWVNSLPK